MEFNLEIFVNDELLINNPIIPNKPSKIHHDRIPLIIKIHNQTNRVFDLSRWRFGLLAPNFITKIETRELSSKEYRTNLENDNLFHMDIIHDMLLPDDWQQYIVTLRSDYNLGQSVIQFALKVFGEIAPKEYLFRIQIE